MENNMKNAITADLSNILGGLECECNFIYKVSSKSDFKDQDRDTDKEFVLYFILSKGTIQEAFTSFDQSPVLNIENCFYVGHTRAFGNLTSRTTPLSVQEEMLYLYQEDLDVSNYSPENYEYSWPLSELEFIICYIDSEKYIGKDERNNLRNEIIKNQLGFIPRGNSRLKI